MDGTAIALSGYKARKWARAVLRQSIKLLLILVFLLLFTFFLYQQGSLAKARYVALLSEKQQVEQQILRVEEHIARLQQSSVTVSSHLSTDDIERLLRELRRLPLSGGLEFVNLASSATPQLKLAGNFMDAHGFAELEMYLKQQGISYRIAHLHSHEQEIEFSLSIDFTDTPTQAGKE